MRQRDVLRAERLAAEDYAWASTWPPTKPRPARGHPKHGEWRRGFNAAWNESDKEFGNKEDTLPPQTAMGLAGWLYFHLRSGAA